MYPLTSVANTRLMHSLGIAVVFGISIAVIWLCVWKRKDKNTSETVAGLVVGSDDPMPASTPAYAPVRPRPRDREPACARPRTPLADVRQYVQAAPDIYHEAVATGHSDEVAWMMECGLVRTPHLPG